MRVNLRDAAAALVATVTVLTAVVCMENTVVDPGIHLNYVDGQVVVAKVDYASDAWRDGLQPGLVVAQLDQVDVLRASDARKQEIGSQVWFQWSTITVVPADHVSGALQQSAIDGGYYDYTFAQNYWYYRLDRIHDLTPIGLGLLILLLGWWWLGSGRAGSVLRPFAVTLPAAVAMPILILPITQLPAFNATIVASLLLSAGMIPLGLDLAALSGERGVRWAGYVVVFGFALAAGIAGLYVPMSYLPGASPVTSIVWAWLAACIVFVPGLAAARPVGWRRGPSEAARSRVPVSADVILPAVTPGIACLSLIWGREYNVWPIILWLGALQARGLSLRPLISRTSRQRDLVVRATEAERARIAADIHDYALQDLTMLVRRLDAAGDAENAQATREVAERLRAICGDLRLPILDDLGVGPALDWLCGRVDASFGSVTLDRVEDESRLPAETELAFFRVAQEAINNAVRHGAPPVRVRYRAGATWAELEVDDRGSGVPEGAAEAAERTGHLGLMNMSQRAEAIHAQLSIGRRPGGGTRVRLVWEGAAELADPSTERATERAASAVEPA